MKKTFLLLATIIFSFSLYSQSIPDPKPIKTLKKQEGAILSLAYQPDGTVLASGSEDKTCLLWSLPEGKVIGSLQGSLSGVHAVLYTPDGSFVCTGGDKVIR